uniref:alanine dehydrogenase n=1 Tax=uncultured prokaryote TaxID=198431 RepID=H5SEK5_9ZZZZ|nr:alanine dehydrogenase [uncultured prokaryote]
MRLTGLFEQGSPMIIGIPKEIREGERRVAITPRWVDLLVRRGHEVLIEEDAGIAAGFSNELYRDAGAKIFKDASQIWERAELIVKVKEPQRKEFDLLCEGKVIFAYLHLAADRELTETLMKKGVVAIGYETVQMDDGSLPLLKPMSEIAGRISIFKGAQYLEAPEGKGIILGSIHGMRRAKVVVLGAGVAGTSAAMCALSLGAEVICFDISMRKLENIHIRSEGRVKTFFTHERQLIEELTDCDILIGSILIPGASCPKVISESMIKQMERGTVFVDLSVDQGGCSETTRQTSHSDPIYKVHGVIHYCVPNVPALVPKTASTYLSNETGPYIMEIAEKGLRRAILENIALRRGVNIYHGRIVHRSVAQSLGLDASDLD